MKFKFKALVAAISFAAVAGQASAMTQTDAILYIADIANSSSFVWDLGAALPSAPINLSTAGADWTSFAGQASYATDLTAGNIKYGLLESISTHSFVTSYATGLTLTAANSPNAGNINNVASVAANLTQAVGAVATNFASAGSAGNNNWNVVAGSNLAALVNFPTYNTLDSNAFTAIGDTASLQVFANSGARGATTSSLPDGTFTIGVAAVPEPESYAMMGAGLLMLGTIARRRTKG